MCVYVCFMYVYVCFMYVLYVFIYVYVCLYMYLYMCLYREGGLGILGPWFQPYLFIYKKIYIYFI